MFSQSVHDGHDGHDGLTVRQKSGSNVTLLIRHVCPRFTRERRPVTFGNERRGVSRTEICVLELCYVSVCRDLILGKLSSGRRLLKLHER